MKTEYYLFINAEKEMCTVEVTKESWDKFLAKMERQGEIIMKDNEDGSRDFIIKTADNMNWFGYTERRDYV